MYELPESATFQFGDFVLDTHARALFRLGPAGPPAPIPLGSRAIDILMLLILRRDGPVSRQQIMDAVWPGTVVEENNLAIQISTLRRVLDQVPGYTSCIQMVPGHGYRFLPDVSQPLSAPIGTAAPTPYPSATGGPATRDDAPSELAWTAPVDLEPAPPERRRHVVLRFAWIAAALCLLAWALVGLLAWHAFAAPSHPRL